MAKAAQDSSATKSNICHWSLVANEFCCQGSEHKCIVKGKIALSSENEVKQIFTWW